MKKATSQQTKAHNNLLILKTIYHKYRNSRADLARQTGLTRTTVSDAVENRNKEVTIVCNIHRSNEKDPERISFSKGWQVRGKCSERRYLSQIVCPAHKYHFCVSSRNTTMKGGCYREENI